MNQTPRTRLSLKKEHQGKRNKRQKPNGHDDTLKASHGQKIDLVYIDGSESKNCTLIDSDRFSLTIRHHAAEKASILFKHSISEIVIDQEV